MGPSVAETKRPFDYRDVEAKAHAAAATPVSGLTGAALEQHVRDCHPTEYSIAAKTYYGKSLSESEKLFVEEQENKRQANASKGK